MSALYHHPVPAFLLDVFFGLVVDLPSAALDHVADVGFILQHIRNAFATPQASVGAGIGRRQTSMSRQMGNFRFIKSNSNFPTDHAVQCHTEDPSHHQSCFLVNDNFVLPVLSHFPPLERFNQWFLKLVRYQPV